MSGKIQNPKSKIQNRTGGFTPYCLWIALLLLVSPALAAKYAGEFLEIGVGARAVGMGGAVTAYINDASGFFWNPAGIGYVEGLQVSGMYADLWEGLANYSVVGVALPVTGAVFSANWVRLGVPDIQEHPNYDQLLSRPDSLRYVVVHGDTVHYNSVQEYLLATDGAPTGVFSDNESAIFLSFAKLNKFTFDLGWSYFSIPIELPIGASLKIVNQSLKGNSGNGIGADFGAQIRVGLNDIFYEKWKARFAYGFNYQDATSTAVDWGNNNKDAVPANFRQGIALTQKLPGPDNKITLSYDYEKRWEFTRHYGVEYQYAKLLSLRGGFWDDEWTAGAGVSMWRITADYAYRFRELGATHRVSLAVRLR
jgi:hypothetical protein